MTSRLVRLAAVVVAVLLGLWGVATLSWPFGWDQGIFAWGGDVVARGGLPYRDAWDTKGPLVFVWHALIHLVFGRTMWGMRLVDLAVAGIAAFAVLRIAAGLTTRTVGIWSAAGFALAWASLGYWNTAQPDGIASAVVAVVAWRVVVPGGAWSSRAALVTGCLIGACALIKPFYGAFLILPVAAAFGSGTPGTSRRGALFSTVAGSVVPFLLVAGWFGAHGAIGSLIDGYLVYPLTVYRGGAGAGLGRLLEFGRYHPMVAGAVPAVAGGLLGLWRRDRYRAVLVAAWLVIAFGCVVIQGRYFRYHWLPLFPPMAVAAGIGFHSAAGLPRRSVRFAAGTLLMLLFLAGSLRPTRAIWTWGAMVIGRVSQRDYWAGFRFDAPYVAGEDIQAAEWIRAHSSEGDRIAIWGWNAGIAYLSGRSVAGRFGFSAPLLLKPNHPVTRSFRAEFIGTLRDERPLYLVISDYGGPGVRSADRVGLYPELADFIAAHYQPAQRIGLLQILRRTRD